MSSDNKKFLISFSYLFTGNLGAQVITVLSSTFICRLYTPEAIGFLDYILSFFTVLVVMVNGKYDNAIMIENDQKEMEKTFFLSVFVNIFSLFFLLIASYLFLTFYLRNQEISSIWCVWWWAPPVLAFCSGLQQSLHMVALKQEKYKLISHRLILQATILSFLQIIMGYSFGFHGALLVYAYLINLVIMIYFFHSSLQFKLHLKGISFRILKKKAGQFRKFPLFTIPTSLVGSLSQRCTYIFLGAFFSLEETGFFSLAMKFIYLPLNLITASTGQVFFKHYAEKKNSTLFMGQILSILKLKVILISLSIPFFIEAPLIFKFVFGNAWEQSGYYATLLAPCSCMLLMTAWLDRVYDVLSKQKTAFMLEFFHMSFLIIGESILIWQEAKGFFLVGFFSIFTALYNLMWLFIALKIMRIPNYSYRQLLKYMLLIISPGVMGYYLLKSIISGQFWNSMLIYYAIWIVLAYLKKSHINILWRNINES